LKLQSFLPYDNSSLANYKAWAQGIGTALSTLGWAKTADTSQVNWANITQVPTIAPIITTWNTPVAWVAGTVYSATAGSPSIVTDAGVTYACILSTTALTLTQALQNTAASFAGTLTTVANASGGNTVYTFSGTPFSANQFQNQQVVITGLANSVNNGTFMCVSNTTTTLTLSNTNGVTATVQAGTATVSASSLSFIGTITPGASNALAGYSMTSSGFVNGANNGTFVVTSSSTTAYAVTQTGVNETHGALAGWATNPVTDIIHWTQENFEIWQSQDALTSTCPIYLRLVYTSSTGSPKGAVIYLSVGTSTTGTGFVSGATYTKAGAEIPFPSQTTIVGQGNVLMECDFSVSVSGGSLSMFLWRDAVFIPQTNIPCVLVLDRAKDNFGQDIDAFFVCLSAASSSGSVGEQIIFKPGSGGPKLPNSTTPWATWSIPCFNGGGNTLNNNNLAPVLPIFPCGLGYLASPCLGAVCFKGLDSVEGAVVSVFMYGAAHSFLLGKGGFTTVDAGSANQAIFVGIRWE
jgi:hypothetical protein